MKEEFETRMRMFWKGLTRQKARSQFLAIFGVIALAAMLFCSAPIFFLTTAQAGDIIEEWDTVKPPKVPELKAVTVDPKTTALLILDILYFNCNEKRRPRCVACLPKIQGLLKRARAKDMTVAYALIPREEFSAKSVRKEVAPLPGELVVKGEVDKFMGNNMEEYLKDKGIKTVIVVGTSARGAVLHTVVGASLRKFKVILPVDGMPDTLPYSEQYTAWHAVTSPGSRRQTTLTRIDMIQF
jgi:nicotinamidase-related amidase